MKLIFTILLLTINFPVLAAEKITEEDFSKGRKAYSAFECSISAGMAENEEDNERLFLLAYENAKQFFKANNEKELDGALINDNVSFILATIDAPNIDFAIGRLYQNIYEILFSKIFDLQNLEEQKKKARKHYNEKNCSLIN